MASVRPLGVAAKGSERVPPLPPSGQTRLSRRSQPPESAQSSAGCGQGSSAEGSKLSQLRQSRRAAESNASSVQATLSRESSRASLRLTLSRQSSRSSSPERDLDPRFLAWLEDSHASALHFRASAPNLGAALARDALQPPRRSNSTGPCTPQRKLSLADLKKFPLAPLPKPLQPASPNPRLLDLSPLPGVPLAVAPSERKPRMSHQPVDTGLASPRMPSGSSPVPSNQDDPGGANLLSMARTEEDLAMNPDIKPEPSVNSANNPQTPEVTPVSSIDKALSNLERYGTIDSNRAQHRVLETCVENASSHRNSAVTFDRAASDARSTQSKRSSAPSKSTTSTLRLKRKKKKAVPESEVFTSLCSD